VEPSALVERKRRGAWYTPPELVRFLVEHTVVPAAAERAGSTVRVLDPACGDGRVLARAVDAVGAEWVDAVGMELDVGAAIEASAGVPAATILVGDGRVLDAAGSFDAVLGNPPYLGQLRRSTTRAGRSTLGGGPYADVAAEFLLRAVELARPDGGRVALVLPQSILASRDTEPIRRAVGALAAVEGIWWVGETVFDAEVHVCVLVVRRGVPQRAIRRWRGAGAVPLSSAPAAAVGGRTWSPLVADLAGVPVVALASSAGRIGDLASAVAGFRDQYYGLVPHVRDRGPGAPLVTTGLVDVGACAWGVRPARFAKRTFAAPRVDLDGLARSDPALAAWYRRVLRSKVLVATQTRVLEAVADERGAWLPSVPVIALLPDRADDLWSLAAVLTAPPVSAWALQRHVGAGLGPRTLKLSAREVLDLPLPDASPEAWAAASALLREGDVDGCAEAMCVAYGVPASRTAALLAWWRAGAVHR
jgi:SAM-dependent methyltransferase